MSSGDVIELQTLASESRDDLDTSPTDSQHGDTSRYRDTGYCESTLSASVKIDVPEIVTYPDQHHGFRFKLWFTCFAVGLVFTPVIALICHIFGGSNYGEIWRNKATLVKEPGDGTASHLRRLILTSVIVSYNLRLQAAIFFTLLSLRTSY